MNNNVINEDEQEQDQQYEDDFDPEQDDANLDNDVIDEEIEEEIEIPEETEGIEDEQIIHPDLAQEQEEHSPDDINLSLNLSESSNSGLDLQGQTDDVVSETELNEQTQEENRHTSHKRWSIGEHRSSSDENIHRDLDEDQNDDRELEIQEQNVEDENLEYQEDVEQEEYPLEEDLDEKYLDRRDELDLDENEDVELDLEAENMETNDQDVWSDDVECIYSSYDSQFICATVRDGSIKIWKKQGLLSIHTIEYPLHGNTQESFLSTADNAVLQAQKIFMLVQETGNSNSTHDIKFDIIVGYENGTLILLSQTDQDTDMNILRGHGDAITAVAADQHWIYSSSRDSSLIIWNRQALDQAKQFRETVQNICLTDQYMYYSTNNSVKIRDKKNFDMIVSWNAHNLDITGLVVYDNAMYTSSNDGTLKMWDTTQITSKNSSKKPSKMVSLEDSIVCMKLSLQGKDARLFCATPDGKLFLWNATTDQQTEPEEMYGNLAVLDMEVDNATDSITMIYALMSDYTLRAKERPEAPVNASTIEGQAEEEQAQELENGEDQYEDDFESAEPTPRNRQPSPRDQSGGNVSPDYQSSQKNSPRDQQETIEEDIAEDIPEEIEPAQSTHSTPRNPETPVATPRQKMEASKNGGPHNTSIQDLEESFEQCLNKMNDILHALPHEEADKVVLKNDRLKSTASSLLSKINVPPSPPDSSSVMQELQQMEAIVKTTSEFLETSTDESIMLNESIDIDSLKNINTSMVKTISLELQKTVNDNRSRYDFLVQTESLLSKMTESIRILTKDKKQYMDQIDMQYKTIHQQAIQIESLEAQNTQLRISQENQNQKMEELKKENDSLSKQLASKAPQDMLHKLDAIKQEQLKTLQEYSGFIGQLQAQISEGNQQLAATQKDLRETESHLSETQSELSEALTKLRQAELHTDEFKLKYDTARDQLDTMKVELQAIRNELNNYKNQNLALQQQNSELSKQTTNSEQLRINFETLSTEHQQLQAVAQQNETDLKQLKQLHSELTTQHENLKAAHSMAQQQTSESEETKEKIKQLEADLAHITQLEANYRADVDRLQDTLHGHQEEMESLKKAKELVEDQYTQLEQTHTDLKQQHHDLTARHQDVVTQSASLEDQIQVLKARSQGTDAETNTADSVAYDELEKLYQRVFSERNELETELENVKQQLEVYETRYEQEIKGANVDTSKIVSKEQYKEMVDNYNQLKMSHEQAMTIHDQLKHDYSELYNTHNETFTRYSDAQNKLALATQDYKKLEETNAALQEQLQDVNAQLQDLREQHKELQDKFSNPDEAGMVHMNQYKAVQQELEELKELYQNLFQERNEMQDKLDLLESKLPSEDSISELEQVKNQYQRVLMQLTGLQDEHKHAQQELQEALKDLEQSKNEHQNVSSELDQLQLEHKNTTQQLQQTSNQLEELKNKHEQLTTDFENLQLEYQDVDQQLKHAKRELQDMKNQSEALQLGHDGSNERLVQVTEELEEMKHQYNLVSSQLEAAQTELEKVEKDSEKQFDQLRLQNVELVAERSQSNTKVQILEDTVQELTKQLDSQKETLTEAATHISTLEKECNTYLEKINELEHKQVHEQFVQTSPREDPKVMQTIRALEQNNQVLKAKLESVNQQYAELNDQLIQQKMDQQNKDEQLNSLEDQKADLERQLEQIQNELIAHQQKAEDHIGLSQQQATQIESLESHIASIQDQYKQTIDEYTETYNKIIEQKDSHIASVEQSLDLLQKEFQSLKRDYDSMKFQYDELGAQYDSLQEDYEAAKTQLQEERHSVTVEVVEQQKMELESLKESHEEELARIRADYEDSLQQFKEDQNRASEQTEQLEEKLNSLSSQFEEQIRFNEKSASEKDQLKQLCEEYASAVESLKGGWHESQQKAADLQRAVKQLQQEKQNLQEQLLAIQQQRHDLQQFVKTLQDQKQDLQEQVIGLKNSPARLPREEPKYNFDLQNQLTQWQSRVQILEDFNDRLTQQNYQLRNDLEQERKQFNQFLELAGHYSIDESELHALLKNIDRVCQQQEIIKAKLVPVALTDNYVDTEMHKDLDAEYLPSHKAMSSLGETVHYLFDVLEANYEQLRAVLTNQVSNNTNFKKILQSLKNRPSSSNPNTPQKPKSNNNSMYNNLNTSGNNINTSSHSLHNSFQNDPSDDWSYITNLAKEQQEGIMDLLHLIQGAASEDATSAAQQSQLRDRLESLQRQKSALEEEVNRLRTALGLAEKQLTQQQSNWKQKVQLLASQVEQKQSEIDSMRQTYEEALFSLIEEKDIIIKEREIEREKFKRDLQQFSHSAQGYNRNDVNSSNPQLQRQLSDLMEERQRLDSLNQHLTKKMEELTVNYNNMLHFFKEQLENITQKNAVCE